MAGSAPVCTDRAGELWLERLAFEAAAARGAGRVGLSGTWQWQWQWQLAVGIGQMAKVSAFGQGSRARGARFQPHGLASETPRFLS